jgi:hypothetical protein
LSRVRLAQPTTAAAATRKAKAFLDSAEAEPSAGPVREQRRARLAVLFGDPGAQDGYGDRGERGDPLASADAFALLASGSVQLALVIEQEITPARDCRWNSSGWRR